MEDARELSYIEGTVDAVVYQNPENGYTVLRLSIGEGRAVTVVGCIPGAAPGEGLGVRGSWGRHISYGEQFKAETVERRLPAGEKAIFDYLSAGTVRGIGAATARKIVEQFGSDALRILEEHPEQLTAIPGVTRKRALAMGESFRSQMGMRRLLEFLSGHDLPLQLAMPIYRKYGDRALETLRRNPYLLVDEELGVDFAAADALALSLGLEGDDPQRLEAALLFELSHNLSNGHTFLPRHKLLAATGQLIGVEEELLQDGLETLLERGEVIAEKTAKEEAIYLFDLYEAECYCAQRLYEMTGEELLPPENMEGVLRDIQRSQGITYAPQQKEAVRLAATSQVMLLTGGPGTGKTTSLRGVLALFEHMGLETALAAPTGRAAKRLGELCGMEAYTIHRLLETRMDPATGRLAFARDEDDPLKADAVIVDEASMVDITLFHALLAALRGECRLLLVGDPDQLPSVGPGNVLSDLLRSGRIPVVRLTEIFRQAAQSAGVRNADADNRGEMPELSGRESDFFFLKRRDPQSTAETVVDLVTRRLPERMGIPSDQIQVLSPTRRYTTGTGSLNRMLQEALNPAAEDKGERRFGEFVFRAGDRVMQVHNNYDIVWRERDGSESGMGMFNGDIGRIETVDPRDGTVTVDFEGKVVEYTPDLLGELESAYAVTVHKAQGSEYRAVILSVMDAAPMLLTRGVLYTAITRARELFILVGDEEKVARMVANDRQQRRYSGLRWRLAQLAE